MSGSAAMRQVSRSFSAISRAVANSTPRPITNMRPVYENDSASFAVERSRFGIASSISSLVRRIPSETSGPRPATWAARSTSAASVLT